MGLIEGKVKERGNEAGLDKLLRECTWLIGGSFLLSAVLNFVLAKVMIKSETGTDAFVEELGRMTMMSYPVIVLPSLAVMMIAIWWLVKGIGKLTGGEVKGVEQILKVK